MTTPMTARNLLLITATLIGPGGCSDQPVGPRPPPAVTVAAWAGNHQTGVVGTALSSPLSVKVDSSGVPKAGVRVTWSTAAGSLAPPSSITDAAGIATATWTLGYFAGPGTASAAVAGAHGSPALFRATTQPGPATTIHKTSGDGQTAPLNRGSFSSLIVQVTDEYGNPVLGQAVTWTVNSGPITLLSANSVTDLSGYAAAVLGPNGTEGGATVRAALPGGTPFATFTLTVGPPQTVFDVVVRTNSTPDAFLSAQNGTTNPAVDTIPVGATMKWTVTPWDYFLVYGRDLVSVGQPSFPQQTFPPDDPSTVSVTFTVPGTYHYADSWSPGGAGIIVVQ